MNNVKFRPVGMKGPITVVRVSQSKAAIYSRHKVSRGWSVAQVNREMDARRFVRVNK